MADFGYYFLLCEGQVLVSYCIFHAYVSNKNWVKILSLVILVF